MTRLVTTSDARLFGLYLGRVLKAERRKRGIKAHAIAEDLGATQQAVSGWETGKTLPELRNLFGACDKIGVPVWRVIALAERAYRMDKTMQSDAVRHKEDDE